MTEKTEYLLAIIIHIISISLQGSAWCRQKQTCMIQSNPKQIYTRAQQ